MELLKINKTENAPITALQAQKAYEIIKEFIGVDPAYFSKELAAAYEILEIFINQNKENGK